MADVEVSDSGDTHTHTHTHTTNTHAHKKAAAYSNLVSALLLLGILARAIFPIAKKISLRASLHTHTRARENINLHVHRILIR